MHRCKIILESTCGFFIVWGFHGRFEDPTHRRKVFDVKGASREMAALEGSSWLTGLSREETEIGAVSALLIPQIYSICEDDMGTGCRYSMFHKLELLSKCAMC